jgi:hypothetical protein
MNETHDSCNIMEEERGKKKRKLETDIDYDQISSVDNSNAIENMRTFQILSLLSLIRMIVVVITSIH